MNMHRFAALLLVASSLFALPSASIAGVPGDFPDHKGQQGSCCGKTPPPPCNDCSKGSPFFPSTGAFQYDVTDLEISGAGFPLSVTRTYDSGGRNRSYFGPGWRLGWESRVLFARRVGASGLDEAYRVAVMPGGQVWKYRQVGTAEDPCSAGSPIFERPFGVVDDLECAPGGGYLIAEKASGLTYFYYPTGNLRRVEDRRGRFLDFTYSGSNGLGQVTRMENDTGDFVDFGYGSNGYVASATDSAGRVVQYRYTNTKGLPDRLKFVTDPLGRNWQYTYAEAAGMPTRLSEVIDHWGRRVQEITYYSPRWFAVLRTQQQELPNVQLAVCPTAYENDGCDGVAGAFGCDHVCLGLREDGMSTLCPKLPGNEARHRAWSVGAVRSYLDSGRTVFVGYGDVDVKTPGVNCEVATSNPNVAAIKVVDGHVYRYVADPTTFQVISRTYPDGGTVTTTIPAKGDPDDTDGRPTRIVDPLGRLTRLEYLVDGKEENTGLVETTSLEMPAGNVIEKTTLSWRAQGRFFDVEKIDHTRPGVTQGIQPTTFIEFDTEPTRPDWAGADKTYRQKPDDPLVQELTSDIDYDHANYFEVSARRDATGGLTEYVYFPGTRDLRFVLLPPNSESKTPRLAAYTYDPRGLHRVASVTSPTGEVTCYEYDLLGRTTRTVAPDPLFPGSCLQSRFGTTIEYDQDPEIWGVGGPYRMTRSTDPNGRITRQFYDLHERLVAVIDPTGAQTEYAYRGQLLTDVIDANKNKTSYAYDESDRLETVTDRTRGAGTAAVTVYSYDLANRLTRTVDPRGVQTDFTYDQRDRLQSKTISGPAVTSGSIVWAYDGDVLRSVTDSITTEVEGGNVLTSYPKYDWQLRPEEIQRHGVPQTLTYDAGDRVTSRTVSGTSVTYGYHPDGSRAEMKDNYRTEYFQYDLAGRLQAIEWADYFDVLRRIVRENFYDPAGRLQAIEHFDPTEGVEPRTCIRLDEYEYDQPTAGGVLQLGMQTAATSTRVATGRGPERREFEYDEAYRLRSVSYPPLEPVVGAGEIRFIDIDDVMEVFHYDAIGNRIARDVIDRKNGDVTLATTYAFAGAFEGTDRSQRLDGLTQQLPGGGLRQVAYTYDVAGNVVAMTETTPAGTMATSFVWDGLGRLSRIDDAIGGTLSEYRYDFDGFRYFANERTSPAQIFREYVSRTEADGDSLTATLQGTSIGFFNGPGIDNRAGAVVGFGTIPPGSSPLFHTTDNVGSVTQVVSHDAPYEVDVFRYDAFGQLATFAGSISAIHGFTGREFALLRGTKPDGTVGGGFGHPRLGYFRARYYDPEVGRFVSPDPNQPYIASNRVFLFETRDVNSYSYTRNSPAMSRDPSGKASIALLCLSSPWAAVGCGAAAAFAGAAAAGAFNQWKKLECPTPRCYHFCSDDFVSKYGGTPQCPGREWWVWGNFVAAGPHGSGLGGRTADANLTKETCDQMPGPPWRQGGH